MVEAMTARNDKHDEKLSTIEVSLGAVQGQMADLLERVNLGQTEPCAAGGSIFFCLTNLRPKARMLEELSKKHKPLAKLDHATLAAAIKRYNSTF
jgi:hypothetical protein